MLNTLSIAASIETAFPAKISFSILCLIFLIIEFWITEFIPLIKVYLSSNLSTFSTTGEKEKVFSLSGIVILEAFSSFSASKESKSSFKKSSKSEDFTIGVSSWIGAADSSTVLVLLFE